MFTCDNDFSPPANKFPIETRLVKYLRIWRGDPNALTANGRNVGQELSSCWNGTFATVFRTARTISAAGGPMASSIWRLARPRETFFKLLGVTWIDCHGIAPFEIDVELDPADECHFAKTIFRIGMLDDQGFYRSLIGG